MIDRMLEELDKLHKQLKEGQWGGGRYSRPPPLPVPSECLASTAIESDSRVVGAVGAEIQRKKEVSTLKDEWV